MGVEREVVEAAVGEAVAVIWESITFSLWSCSCGRIMRNKAGYISHFWS